MGNLSKKHKKVIMIQKSAPELSKTLSILETDMSGTDWKRKVFYLILIDEIVIVLVYQLSRLIKSVASHIIKQTSEPHYQHDIRCAEVHNHQYPIAPVRKLTAMADGLEQVNNFREGW